MTLMVAHHTAKKIAHVVREYGKEKGVLKDVSVEVAPQGVPTPHDYVFNLSFAHIKGGTLHEGQRAQLREFVLNGLSAKIKSITGWGDIRIRTCSRQQNPGKYVWFVEPR